MFMGQTADTSPYRVFKASAAITAGAFTAVTLGENGVATSAAGDIPVGILSAETGDVAQGEDVNAQIMGGTLWLAGEAIKQGDLLAAGDDGKAAKAASGKYIFAIALETAAANQAVAVQIINAGVKG